MKHRKNTRKLGRTSSHYRCTMANLLKSLILHNVIETSVAKGRHLRRYADKMITLAKKRTLASRRQAVSTLMVRFNSLTPKEQRQAKEGNLSAYNSDRLVIKKLFDELGPQFLNRKGGYTRMVKLFKRPGDNSEKCLVEYIQNQAQEVVQSEESEEASQETVKEPSEEMVKEASEISLPQAEENSILEQAEESKKN